MFARFLYRFARVVLLVLILASISGCGTVNLGDLLGSSNTPTADPTLLAIPVMLTQAAAAPTPAPTATPAPDPTGALMLKQGAQIPQTGSREAPASPGQRVQAGPYALFILPPKLVQAVGSNKARAGRAYLDVQVVLQNTGSQPVPYAALFFHVTEDAALQSGDTASRAGLQPSTINSPQSPALLSGDLAPGDCVRGHLFFDVPEKGGSYAASFDTRGDSATAVWVDLTQPGASDNLPAPEGRERLPGLGKRVENSGEALTLQSIAVRQTYGRYKPASSNQFVELDATIQNVSLTSVSYNADYFRIKDSSGFEYPPTVIPSETQLLAGSLTQGRQVSGHIIFEIPASARGLIVSYQPVVIGKDFVPIRMQVELPASR